MTNLLEERKRLQALYIEFAETAVKDYGTDFFKGPIEKRVGTILEANHTRTALDAAKLALTCLIKEKSRMQGSSYLAGHLEHLSWVLNHYTDEYSDVYYPAVRHVMVLITEHLRAYGPPVAPDDTLIFLHRSPARSSMSDSLEVVHQVETRSTWSNSTRTFYALRATPQLCILLAPEGSFLSEDEWTEALPSDTSNTFEMACTFIKDGFGLEEALQTARALGN